jgi:hypothetical protein
MRVDFHQGFLNNYDMTLPVYLHITLKTSGLDELEHILSTDINLRHPVAFNLKLLDLDQQREMIGLIENFFVSSNISFKFPYPVYVICDHERSISNMPIFNETTQLPRFFNQRELKMNIKESHLAGRNMLLQQEVKNIDASSTQQELTYYGESHRLIYEREKERTIYRSILNGLMKVKKNG